MQQGPVASPLPGHTAALPAAVRVAVCRQLETRVRTGMSCDRMCMADRLPLLGIPRLHGCQLVSLTAPRVPLSCSVEQRPAWAGSRCARLRAVGPGLFSHPPHTPRPAARKVPARERAVQAAAQQLPGALRPEGHGRADAGVRAAQRPVRRPRAQVQHLAASGRVKLGATPYGLTLTWRLAAGSRRRPPPARARRRPALGAGQQQRRTLACRRRPRQRRNHGAGLQGVSGDRGLPALLFRVSWVSRAACLGQLEYQQLCVLQLCGKLGTQPQTAPPAPCRRCALRAAAAHPAARRAQAGLPECLQRRRPQPGTALWRAPRGCSPPRRLPRELARQGRHRRQPGGVLHAAGRQDSAALQPACLAWPPSGGPPHTCLRSSTCTALPQAANAVCGSPGCTASEGTASPPRARPMRCTAAPCRKSKTHTAPSSPPDSTVWPSACSAQHSTGATCPARRLCASCDILLVPQPSTGCMDSATVPWVTVGRWQVTCAVSWR